MICFQIGVFKYRVQTLTLLYKVRVFLYVQVEIVQSMGVSLLFVRSMCCINITFNCNRIRCILGC